MPMHIVCMYSLLWQTVYTDAHAYSMHVMADSYIHVLFATADSLY